MDRIKIIEKEILRSPRKNRRSRMRPARRIFVYGIEFTVYWQETSRYVGWSASRYFFGILFSCWIGKDFSKAESKIKNKIDSCGSPVLFVSLFFDKYVESQNEIKESRAVYWKSWWEKNKEYARRKQRSAHWADREANNLKRKIRRIKQLQGVIERSN